MENKLRRYVLKSKDKKNVQRSLQGACKRSYDGSINLSFHTKSARLPAGYEQHKTPGGGTYIKVDSHGRFDNDFLKIVIYGRSPDDNAIFINNAGIRLVEIDGPIYVCYWEAA